MDMEGTINISGYILDKQHIVSPAVDADGKITWWLVTFLKDIVDNQIICESADEQIFEVEQIDPDNFEWNGMSLQIAMKENDEQNSNTVAEENFVCKLNY